MTRRERLIADLDDVLEWLQDQIDGGEECRGRDQTISRHIQTVADAITDLKTYSWLSSDKD